MIFLGKVLLFIIFTYILCKNIKEGLQEVIPNCKEMDNGQCIQCMTGYDLKNNKCISQNPLENCTKMEYKELGSQQCKAGYKETLDGKKCFRYYDENKTRKSAEKLCKSDDATLAIIENDQENTFAKKISTGAGRNEWWIGCTDSEKYDTTKGKWIWPDKSPMIYHNLEPGHEKREGRFCYQNNDMYWKTQETEDEKFEAKVLCSHPLKKVQEAEEICTMCQYGYILSEDKKHCIPINITNCEEQDETICTKCKKNYKLSDNKKKCDEIFVENCLKQQNGLCKKCNKGYVLKGKKCELEPLPNCFSRKGTTCLHCDNGYLLDKNTGTCLPMVKTSKAGAPRLSDPQIEHSCEKVKCPNNYVNRNPQNICAKTYTHKVF